MRKLASIRVIKDISPIPGADMIEVVTVGGWKVVAAKDMNYKVGDKVIYCEVDSFLPIKPEYEFLRKSSYKKLADGSEGFRLRTIKLKGQISQGLLLPIATLYNPELYKEGDDVTELLNIVKYEPPMPAELAGVALGYLPSFIRKTDEERIQNLTEFYEELCQDRYAKSEKLDGASTTYYLHEGKFGVCSRNIELADFEGNTNTQWRIAKELKIEESLKRLGKNIAIQGEMIGEGIQGNKYNLKGQKFNLFRVLNLDTGGIENYTVLLDIAKTLNIDTVPILSLDESLPSNIQDLIESADGYSQLFTVLREGVVYRSKSKDLSFKVISNKFLAKHESS